MATFPYRCPDDGEFEVTAPIGTAAPKASCPDCGTDSRRVFTAPRLNSGDRRRMALIDRCERTGTAPDVVTTPPRRSGPAAPAGSRNPAWSRLPRP